MYAAVALFAAAAAGGVFLFTRRLGKKELPLPVALAHGALAAIALALLIVAVFGGPAATTTKIALGVFVVAALGGFALLSFDLRKRELPMPLVVVHGLAAVVAFVILLIGVVA